MPPPALPMPTNIAPSQVTPASTAVVEAPEAPSQLEPVSTEVPQAPEADPNDSSEDESIIYDPEVAEWRRKEDEIQATVNAR